MIKGLGDAKIIEADLIAMNGFVHVVSDVIVKEDCEFWHGTEKQRGPSIRTVRTRQLDSRVGCGQDCKVTIWTVWQKQEDRHF